MCFNCGCFNPNDDMGSEDNITNSTLEKFAKKHGKSVSDIKNHLRSHLENNTLDKDPELKEMFQKAADTWGQSVEEAKANTLKLLKTSK